MNIPTPKSIRVVNLGLTDYQSAWEMQRTLLGLRAEKKIGDVLLLNEHHHVYTLGKNSDKHHLLANRDELRSQQIDVYEVERGGDVTYHGPGQLVGYPILDLSTYYLDLHRYLRDLEEVIILTLREFGVAANRDKQFTGVWVGNEKIAAIGVKVSRWITMHGFALNVNTDLSYFDRIIPCGIFHKGVTSLERLLGTDVPLGTVSKKLSRCFGKVFHADCAEEDAKEFLQTVSSLTSDNKGWLQVESLQ